jgi:O-antigen chain-terminating methyltransferase
MNANTIEIREDEINVEEIMEKIRENIRRRQAAGELPLDPDSKIGSTAKNSRATESDDAIQRDLSYINSNWDIRNNNYFISSHHPCIGKFLVKGRQLVNGEVRRYVDPMVFHQTEVNAGMVRILAQTSKKDTELDLKISQQEQELTRKISQQEDELTRKISQQEHELTQRILQQSDLLNINIKNCVLDVFSQFENELRLQTGLVHLLERRIQKGLEQTSIPTESLTHQETNYFLFEERFRGSREDIIQRQMAFLPYFKQCSRVLDIGCGRGEFLEILRDQGIGGIGVDSDPDMVAYCRSRQLEVEQSDAIAYLETLEDKSLDGIFIDQVVEHLEPGYLIRLLALCYQKMKFGYHIVIETVNPLSFVSFVNFYIDMTHTRPVHPETLQYLISAIGFRECEKKFFSPVSDAGRLKTVEGSAEMNENERRNADVYNHNVEMLNTVLFGPQDYAVVGKK